jgi:hypothetical protein
MKYFTITAKIVEVIVLSVKMRSREGTSSMNTIDLFRKIMQEKNANSFGNTRGPKKNTTSNLMRKQENR